MRLLAFTDLHGNMRILEQLKQKITERSVDYVLCCGDITNFGMQQKKIVKEISEFSAPVIMIHGNHENPDKLEKECNRYENIIFLHSSAYRVEDIIFFGYGGDGFSFNDSSFRDVSEKFSRDVKPGDKVVVLFHGPPHGVLDETTVGNSGNKDYKRFIEEMSPVNVVCGHIHESAGKKKKVGNTLVMNPGPSGMIFDI